MSAVRRILVVGASLGGLAMANTLSRSGAEVQVFERGAAGFETRGGGLGLDLSSAGALRGGELPAHLILHERRIATGGAEMIEPTRLPVTSYGAMWAWMRAGLHGSPVNLRFGTRVTAIASDASRAHLVCEDGSTAEGDLIVLADGGASALRAQLPGVPAERHYAGYVLWRGLVPAAEVTGEDELVERFHLATDPSHHFVAYPIPTADGRTGANERGINWGWYFPLAEADMQALYDAELTDAPHAIGRLVMPAAWTETLSMQALHRWPPWARRLVATSTRLGLLAPHPIYEYRPACLSAGRIVLAGDVAHQASPITGAGARMGIEDALVLGDALSRHAELPAALAVYTDVRLGAVQAVVEHGIKVGARFGAPDCASRGVGI